MLLHLRNKARTQHMKTPAALLLCLLLCVPSAFAQNKETLETARTSITQFLGNSSWHYFKLPEVFGDQYYQVGNFMGEPDTNKTLDLAVLVEDTSGRVQLLVIDAYQQPAAATVVHVDIRTDFSWAGRFKAVRPGEPLWENYVESPDEVGFRELEEVPKNEIVYLPYDALYVHAGESCGGGFIFYQHGQWHWLQQE